MKRIDVVTTPWNDYELIDSGNSQKLERFGSLILNRPDPQAIWNQTLPDWSRANATFLWQGEGSWKKNTTVEEWNISYDKAVFKLSFGNFKHIGIFPEHSAQWVEIKEIARKNPKIRMLNLFGYTGAASIIAAQYGAMVTHVDASKQTLKTVKENIKLSGLPEDVMRIVCEDALKYTKRLVQREEQFEIILLDPPAFGRGPKGEVWKIEERLAELISLIPNLLSPSAKLVILNGYAAGFSARSFGELLSQYFNGEITYGDIGIEENTNRILSTGIYARWGRE